MSSNAFGNFGSFKLKYLEDEKREKLNNPDAAIDVTNVSHTLLKDIEYFKRNLKPNNQIVNYTWEKSSDESPSIYVALNEEFSESKTHKNTLDQMAVYHGYPHVQKQNKWESDPNGPPEFLGFPQKRRTTVLSTMTQYTEEMNKTFPGVSMF